MILDADADSRTLANSIQLCLTMRLKLLCLKDWADMMYLKILQSGLLLWVAQVLKKEDMNPICPEKMGNFVVSTLLLVWQILKWYVMLVINSIQCFLS